MLVSYWLQLTGFDWVAVEVDKYKRSLKDMGKLSSIYLKSLFKTNFSFRKFLLQFRKLHNCSRNLLVKNLNDLLFLTLFRTFLLKYK